MPRYDTICLEENNAATQEYIRKFNLRTSFSSVIACVLEEQHEIYISEHQNELADEEKLILS